jgi:hypothetical protein
MAIVGTKTAEGYRVPNMKEGVKARESTMTADCSFLLHSLLLAIHAVDFMPSLLKVVSFSFLESCKVHFCCWRE